MSTKHIFSNVAWAGSLKIAGVLATMGVNVLVARMLDVEYVGYYFLTSSLAVFGALVARLGMRQSVVKLVAQNVALGAYGTAAGIIRKVLATTLCGVLITAVVLVLMGNWINLQLYQSTRFNFVIYVIPWLGLLA